MNIVICLVLTAVLGAEPDSPEKDIALSPLQQELKDAHSKCVLPTDDLDDGKRHYFRLKKLSFEGQGGVQDQIEAYEQENRRGYDGVPSTCVTQPEKAMGTLAGRNGVGRSSPSNRIGLKACLCRTSVRYCNSKTSEESR